MRGASRVLLVAAITGSLGVLLTGVLRPGVSDAPDPPLVTDATLNTSGGAPPGTPASMPPAWSAAHAIAAAAQSARPQAAEAAPEAPVPAPDAAPQASTPGEMDSPAAQAAPAADAPHDAAAADPLEIGGLIEDAALAALVQQHLAPLRGVFGVAIKDLDSGRGVLINADRMLPAASLFKLAVMYEVFRQHDAGQLQLTERLTLSAHYAQYDLGTLDLPVGSVLSIQDALERMITRSDNSTANLLLDRVGVANVNATMRALGLEATRIAREQLTTCARHAAPARADRPRPGAERSQQRGDAPAPARPARERSSAGAAPAGHAGGAQDRQPARDRARRGHRLRARRDLRHRAAGRRGAGGGCGH